MAEGQVLYDTVVLKYLLHIRITWETFKSLDV